MVFGWCGSGPRFERPSTRLPPVVQASLTAPHLGTRIVASQVAVIRAPATVPGSSVSLVGSVAGPGPQPPREMSARRVNATAGDRIMMSCTYGLIQGPGPAYRQTAHQDTHAINLLKSGLMRLPDESGVGAFARNRLRGQARS